MWCVSRSWAVLAWMSDDDGGARPHRSQKLDEIMVWVNDVHNTVSVHLFKYLQLLSLASLHFIKEKGLCSQA